MTGNIAIYPGTFDPVTLGHLDMIKRGLKLFDGLIVAVAGNSSKDTLFKADERLAMLQAETEGLRGVTVESFDTLLVDYAKRRGVGTIIRGLRVISDFEYEFQMALTNRKLAAEVETVFMMTSENYASISSRFIKDIARLGGDVSHFVTPAVAARLKEKYSL
ncbi:MAG: pantetheine-phosphate adenylyltransferase [Thermodesulfobacteriota bacterium]